MTVEFRGVSTASLGAMLKGYGVMAGVANEWPEARFWWTPAGTVASEVVGVHDFETDSRHKSIHDGICRLKQWAQECGKAFEKPRANKKTGKEAGSPPLEDVATWGLLKESLALDAEGAGVCAGGIHRPNPVLANWGQDASANLFAALRDAGKKGNYVDC